MQQLSNNCTAQHAESWQPHYIINDMFQRKAWMLHERGLQQACDIFTADCSASWKFAQTCCVLPASSTNGCVQQLHRCVPAQLRGTWQVEQSGEGPSASAVHCAFLHVRL
jgi:hypothetical protein